MTIANTPQADARPCHSLLVYLFLFYKQKEKGKTGNKPSITEEVSICKYCTHGSCKYTTMDGVTNSLGVLGVPNGDILITLKLASI